MSSSNNAGVIEKSAIDAREYRHITLPNKMDCILISDPETEKSSACCDVLVGSMCDPQEVPGLAHFLEHMLFLGTEKYPVENAYSAFLSSHGGSSNAYTAQEDTVYYFDVQNDHFENALDMFSSFFTCPLFSESATNREINAVDSEHAKNLQNDSWRKWQLFKSLVRPDHPLNSFSTGNLETLGKGPESRGVNTRDVVIEFYQKYYSANLMKLVVYGKESLDVLEGWVTDKFSLVPNKNLTRPLFESDPLREPQLAKYLEAVPIRDVKTMEVLFPLPAVEHLYLTKPTRYLSHMVGHESAGSILSALKAKLWANGLGCYLYQSLNDFAVFSVSVELTEEGVAHVEEIAECVFAYIGMLQREGPQQWAWLELKEAADMSFRFINKTEPAEYCTKLANNMQRYAPEHSITGDELLFQCDLDKTTEFLQYLRPRNSVVACYHRGLAGKTALKEKWYGTEHNLADVNPEVLAKWENSASGSSTQWDGLVFLPKPNPFIPTDFALKNEASADGAKFPSLIQQVATKASESADLFAKEGDATEAVEAVAVSVEDVALEEKPAAADKESEQADEEENGGEEEDEEEEEEEEQSGPVGELPSPPGKHLSTWFLPDTTWKVPKMNVYVCLESAHATNSPLHVVFTELLASCLKEVLSEYSYYADCAGLHYDVELSKGGLTLSFNGYQHKLPVLVAKATEELKNLSSGQPGAVQAELFARLKEKALRTYKNFVFWQPYYHCIANSLNCLEDPRWTHAEKFSALSAASISDFISFASVFLRSLKAEVLVHGNATKEESAAITATVLDTLKFAPLPNSQEFVRRSVELTAGATYLYRDHSARNNPNEVNSGIENIYLVDRVGGFGHSFDETRDKVTDFTHPLVMEALVELVTHIVAEPAFDQLRTKEQLGYIVHTGTKKVGQQLGVHLIVQSGVKDPHYLDTRVEDFLVAFRAELAQYSAEKFQSYVQAVVEKLVEKPKNIDEESSRHWEEIRNNSYLFARKRLLVSVLQSAAQPLALDTVLAFFDRFLLPNPLRKKFSSQFYGAKTKFQPVSAGVVHIRDLSQFKRGMQLSPVQVFEPTELA